MKSSAILRTRLQELYGSVARTLLAHDPVARATDSESPARYFPVTATLRK